MSAQALPARWANATLGDVIEPIASIDPSKVPDALIDYIDIGSIDSECGVVMAPKSISGADAPSRARQAVHEGDVLFSTVRPYLRAIAPVPKLQQPVASTGFCVLRPAPGVDRRYLLHWVRSTQFIDGVLPLQRGSSYPAVRDADVHAQPLPLAPAAEQRRVAERLDELLSALDAAAAELTEAKRKLALYRQSLLKSAVEGTLTAEWRIKGSERKSGATLLQQVSRRRQRIWSASRSSKYVPPLGFEGRALFELPRGWVWASIDEVTQSSSYGTSTKCDAGAAGTPVLRIPNLRSGHISLSDLKYSTAPLRMDDPEYLRPGDVLVVRTNGSVSIVGNAACVPRPGLGGNFYFASYLLRLHPVLPRLMGAWIAAWLRSPPARQLIEAMAASSAGQHNIGLSALLRLPIPIAPVAEMWAALGLFSEQSAACEAHDSAIALALKMASAQRQNILRAAFSGQLVPQDPNDEPASALLERIRAQRQPLSSQPARARRPRRAAC